MENWQKPTPVKMRPRANNQSGFWNTVDEILKVDQATQRGILAGFTFTPADTTRMNGWQKTGYYFGEAVGIIGGMMTGELASVGLSKALVLGSELLAGSKALGGDAFSKLAVGFGLWTKNRIGGSILFSPSPRSALLNKEVTKITPISQHYLKNFYMVHK